MRQWACSGRFQALAVQEDDHDLTVLRYIERNPPRSGPAEGSHALEWSSLGQALCRGSRRLANDGSLAKSNGWTGWVNGVESESELEALRRSVNRGNPFGEPDWQQRTAKRLGLEASLRPGDRPREADRR
jgi:putative transposase